MYMKRYQESNPSNGSKWYATLHQMAQNLLGFSAFMKTLAILGKNPYIIIELTVRQRWP